MKSNSDHSSPSRFSTGVPVSASRTRLCSALAALVWRAPPPAGSLAPPDRQPPLLQMVTLGPGESAPALEGLCPAPARIAAQKLALELASSSREELTMASLAAEIMGELRPVSGARSDGGKWIDRVVEAISDEPERRWRLPELAAIAGRHPVHVAQSFRATTGISLGAYQRLRRLTSLALALRHGNAPLAALAADFGYCDQSHMTSEFRSIVGVSPGRYRRELH